MILGGKGKTPTPKAEARATATPEPKAVSTPTPESTPIATPAPSESKKPSAPICPGLFILLPLPLAALFLKKSNND
jgi:hypothetical protein